jgi:hypothetical protein
MRRAGLCRADHCVVSASGRVPLAHCSSVRASLRSARRQPRRCQRCSAQVVVRIGQLGELRNPVVAGSNSFANGPSKL